MIGARGNSGTDPNWLISRALETDAAEISKLECETWKITYTKYAYWTWVLPPPP